MGFGRGFELGATPEFIGDRSEARREKERSDEAERRRLGDVRDRTIISDKSDEKYEKLKRELDGLSPEEAREKLRDMRDRAVTSYEFLDSKDEVREGEQHLESPRADIEEIGTDLEDVELNQETHGNDLDPRQPAENREPQVGDYGQSFEYSRPAKIEFAKGGADQELAEVLEAQDQVATEARLEEVRNVIDEM